MRLESRYPRVDDFAARVGVSSRAVHFYERGEKIPRPATLDELATVAGVDTVGRERLAVLRAEAIAQQSGMSVSIEIGENPDELARRLAVAAVSVLRRRGRSIAREDAYTLQAAFHDVLCPRPEPSSS